MRYGRDQEEPLWDDDPMWDDEASSYDEASRARYRRRASRRGGSGPGGFDNGIKYMFIWAELLFWVANRPIRGLANCAVAVLSLVKVTPSWL